MSNYTYTNKDSELSNNIYFLNDKNIVHEINDANVSGLNPIASYDIVRDISAGVSSTLTNINDVRDTYFKLSADNNISGNNIYLGKQTIDNLSITNDVYVYFSKLFNNESGKLSDLHDID